MSPRELWWRLSGRDRRAIRLGALVLAPALAWFFAVSPYLETLREHRSQLDAHRSLLAAERDLLAGRARYPRQVRAAALRLQRRAPALLDSRSRGVAAAELTQFLEDRAAAHRLRLVTTEPRPTRPVDRRLLAVPVQVEGESDLRGILGFVRALETGPKLLRVDGVRIRRRRGAPGPEDAEGMEVLALRATVTGYMLFPRRRRSGGPSAAPEVTSGDRPVGTETGGNLADRADRTGGGP